MPLQILAQSHIDEGASSAYLATQLRTTEEHVTDHQPSINGLWFPVSHEDAKEIRANYRQSGSPRLEVTRIIDLGGYLWGDGARPSHVFVFAYGKWLELFGTNPAIQNLLRENPAKRARLRNLARVRLYPAALERAEMNVIARGELAAVRTVDWIDRSKSWAFAEFAVDAQPWADHVRGLAEQVLSSTARRGQQKEAARSLVYRLFGDASLAHDVVEVGFDSLTEGAGESRSALVDVLFKTAQQPFQDSRTTEIATAFAADLPILSCGLLGWDIRTAVAAAAKGAP